MLEGRISDFYISEYFDIKSEYVSSFGIKIL